MISHTYRHPATAEAGPSFDLGELRLRPLRATDLPQVYAGLSDPRVIAHYGVSYDSLAAAEEQMAWYRHIVESGSGIWWALARQTDDQLIGACGFNDWCHPHRRIELGYWLLPHAWGQGLMRRALPVILVHALQTMGVHRVHADVEPENLPSVKLLQALGFTLEGTLRDVECKAGSFLSLHQFSLLASDPAADRLRATLA
ncbi:GNAT family protein [Pseudomonas sp. DTU_2021_1001937_2_SI_NGA_ILE_001]|uniref:GNAT family N-acetyltransferase n=1 Tax=Pseudomonas sp. DTU_2021_1001937_2_SI_NGA_ILE_001 TaxID=3077589 RepID=UPI0028FC0D11|nr:GNAT family protein [Pseudomonas sp. DTU_2021_1001937_2_SI_NGA_ILE_001]WNW09792.1 GNAT family protein [Pseudomonas sp. DTU_2021_1001937_2_SI_NGA_ILE_001]